MSPEDLEALAADPEYERLFSKDEERLLFHEWRTQARIVADRVKTEAAAGSASQRIPEDLDGRLKEIAASLCYQARTEGWKGYRRLAKDIERAYLPAHPYLAAELIDMAQELVAVTRLVPGGPGWLAPIGTCSANDDAHFTCKDLAKKHGVSPEALRKRLDRFRKNSMNGWKEVENPHSREARFIFSEKHVRPIIEDLKQRQKKASS
jgi:hypothetical protein